MGYKYGKTMAGMTIDVWPLIISDFLVSLEALSRRKYSRLSRSRFLIPLLLGTKTICCQCFVWEASAGLRGGKKEGRQSEMAIPLLPRGK